MRTDQAGDAQAVIQRVAGQTAAGADQVKA
jgi:hypothetical protein